MKQARVTAQAFLAAIQGKTQELELDGVGVVGIRSLTTEEAAKFGDMKGSASTRVIAAIELGLTEPHLTPVELAQLSTALAGPVMMLAKAILVLSGLGDSADSLEGEVGGGS